MLMMFPLLLASAPGRVEGQKLSPAGHPKIEITLAPPSSEGGSKNMNLIQGVVSGPTPSGSRVVIYSFAGSIWWVQPTADEPYTQVGKTGNWSAVIHLGQVYSALLVTGQYKAQAKLASLPLEGGEVLAVASVPGR
jgi:hypothetical protein